MTDSLKPHPDSRPHLLKDAGQAFPAVARVLRHWESLRDGRAMPRRNDIDPRDLAEELEYLFVAEPVAPGVARLRLAGQHLTQLLGMEPRGMPLCALFEGPSREEIARAVEQVAGHGLRALLPLRAAGGLGRPALEGLMALMPLEGEGGAPRILGVLQTRGPMGRSPRRLTLSGPVEPVAPAEAPPAAIGSRPVLRVIDGGRR